ncbi:MAG: hypothetical protein LRY66_06080 [Saccharospirillaceae bacterium]|nr:hypothetical protein [Saccharospirillaceae bacterium]MCD8530924.1 hypothetical protein [Saccharospirillaceae bacterium]
MMWNKVNRSLSPWVVDPGICNQQSDILNTLVLPSDISIISGLSEIAKNSAKNRIYIDAESIGLDSVAILPWHSGNNDDGRSLSGSFSAEAAQDLLANASAGYPAMIAFIIPADNADQLAQKLAALNTVIPSVKLTQAIRIAEAIAMHDTEKFLIQADTEVLNTVDGALREEYREQDYVISVSEAVASDTSPLALLSSFAQSRAQRRADQISGLNSISGHVEWAVYLQGDLPTLLSEIDTPNAAAPYSAAFAFMGKADALATLKQELGL